jgi:hypothetical protein
MTKAVMIENIITPTGTAELEGAIDLTLAIGGVMGDGTIVEEAAILAEIAKFARRTNLLGL